MDTKPKRRWFRFSLRTLFVVVTLTSAGFGWLGMKVRAKQREREAVKRICNGDGAVDYDYELNPLFSVRNTPPGPACLRGLLGDDVFANVAIIYFGPSATDEDIRTLSIFSQLQALCLHSTQVTDAGLINLRQLHKLQELDLVGTRVTDVAMVHLTGLGELKLLDLSETTLTDAGLVHLRKLTKLEELSLYKTQVTVAGAEQFQKMLPNLKISR